MAEKIGWALIGTGNIVKKFLVGLRSLQDIGSVYVVSRDQNRAEAFAQAHGLDAGYSDLDEVLADPKIHIVYIGTPHPTHKEYALRALRAKKAVLCEKPVCMNADEMQEILDVAKANQTFFMEAMWTRFMPAIRRAIEWIDEGQIGRVRMVQANFGFDAPWDPKGRLLNMMLGGGALLDAGIYPLSLAFLAFGCQGAKAIHSTMHIGETGVDEQVSCLLDFGEQRTAMLSASVRTRTVNDAWIYGETGCIHLPNFVFGRSATLNQYGKFSYTYSPDVVGNGYGYEAEEVVQCVRAGKACSPSMSMEESLAIMRVMDQIRAQGGLRYPFE